MDVKGILREQMQSLHGTMEAAIGDCTAEVVANKLPGAKINSIGAIYAHTVMSEDGLLNGLVRGETPVYFAKGWAAKIGLDMPKGGMEPDWTVDYDLGLFRQYARDVYQRTYDYLETISDDELDRIIDLGFAPPMSIRSFVADLMAWHVATHQGEISALKGVQGLEGLVFAH